MTEPQRLLDGAGDDLERALLSAAKGDEPSAQAMRRCLVGLSLGGATAAAAAATAGVAALVKGSIPPAAAATAATAAGAAGMSVLVKWVGIAGVGALATWGVVETVTHEEPIALQPAAAPGQIELPPIAPEEEEQAAPAVDPAEEAPVAETETPRPTPVRKAAPKTKSDLAGEVAALDRARKKMEDDPDGALAALEGYDAKFKDGALAQEAEALRIESLARAGKNDQARAAAKSFLARHPQSPAAARVRSVVSSLKP